MVLPLHITPLKSNAFTLVALGGLHGGKARPSVEFVGHRCRLSGRVSGYAGIVLVGSMDEIEAVEFGCK